MAHISVLQLIFLPGCDEMYVQFLVDGRDLGEMVRHHAGEHARFFFDDALPYHGGDYQQEDTVLGRAARTLGLQGAMLFACGCGHSACSSVSCDVSLTDATISLGNFRVYRDRTSSLAPLSFTRTNYEAAIIDLERQAAIWMPPPLPPPKPPIALGGTIDPSPEIHPEQEC